VLLTAESRHVNVPDDANCVDVRTRSVHGEAACIQ